MESSFGFASPVLSSLDGANKSVVVKWKKPINGTITGYEIFRSTSSIPSTTSSATFVIAKADSLFLIDTALVNLTKYYYRVRAYSGTTSKSYSAFSNELFVYQHFTGKLIIGKLSEFIGMIPINSDKFIGSDKIIG